MVIWTFISWASLCKIVQMFISDKIKFIKICGTNKKRHSTISHKIWWYKPCFIGKSLGRLKNYSPPLHLVSSLPYCWRTQTLNLISSAISNIAWISATLKVRPEFLWLILFLISLTAYKVISGLRVHWGFSPWTQDVNWTYTRRSQKTPWMSSERLMYVQFTSCVQGVVYFICCRISYYFLDLYIAHQTNGAAGNVQIICFLEIIWSIMQ